MLFGILRRLSNTHLIPKHKGAAMKNDSDLLIAADAEGDRHDEKLVEYMHMLVHRIMPDTYAIDHGAVALDTNRKYRDMVADIGKNSCPDVIDDIIAKRGIEKTAELLIQFLGLLEEYNDGDTYHGIVELFIDASLGSIALWVAIDERENDALETETNILIAASRADRLDQAMKLSVQVVDAEDGYEVPGHYDLALLDRRSEYEQGRGVSRGTV